MGYCLTQNIQINWTASVQINQKPCAKSEYSDQHALGICCVRWVFAVRPMLREMLKHKVSSYKKREDPDQNGRMPTHGEWMLFLKGAINNEWVSLELPFSIEIHFCPKLSPNSVQLSATLLTIHIKCEQVWPTRLCDIEFWKSDYSRAIMHFML